MLRGMYRERTREREGERGRECGIESKRVGSREERRMVR